VLQAAERQVVKGTHAYNNTHLDCVIDKTPPARGEVRVQAFDPINPMSGVAVLSHNCYETTKVVIETPAGNLVVTLQGHASSTGKPDINVSVAMSKVGHVPKSGGGTTGRPTIGHFTLFSGPMDADIVHEVFQRASAQTRWETFNCFDYEDNELYIEDYNHHKSDAPLQPARRVHPNTAAALRRRAK